MLIELYIFFEIVMIVAFATAFFTKQEIIWGIAAVISGMLMFTSYHIETYLYQFNETLSVYQPVAVSYSYGYMMAINMLFFVLSLLLSIFDMWDKYGTKFLKKSKQL